MIFAEHFVGNHQILINELMIKVLNGIEQLLFLLSLFIHGNQFDNEQNCCGLWWIMYFSVNDRFCQSKLKPIINGREITSNLLPGLIQNVEWVIRIVIIGA